MAHEPRFADDQEIVLDGHPLKVRGRVEYNVINISGPKVNQGEPGPDDHPVLSTHVQRNTIGGGQIWRNDPSADVNRFWWARALTQWPDAITLPWDYTEVATPTDGVDPLEGEVWVHGYHLGEVVASWGDIGRTYDFTDGDFETTDITLASTPVGRGTVFVPQTGAEKGNALLYFPLGAQGYDYWDGSGAVVHGTELAVDFEVWDSKLYVLTTTGIVRYTIDGVTWVDISATDELRLPDGSTPKKLCSYYFDAGSPFPSLHLVTDEAVWLVDVDNQVLHRTDLQFPQHPHQGDAAAVWRGDLHVSVGTGVHRTNGSLITTMGLDRDNGLPEEFNGNIVDFAPEYNGLYALLEGAALDAETGDDDYEMLTGPTGPSLYGSVGQSNSLLMVWNGFGWHYVWHGAGLAPTSVVVASAEGTYRVWWAAGGSVWYQDLPISFFAPKEPGTATYRPTGEFETSWINWGWLGMPKILKLIELQTLGCSEDETITVSYKLDSDDAAWVQVGVISSDGEHAFKTGQDADGRYVGAPHEQVKLRFQFARGSDNTLHPVIEWYSLGCRKFLRPIRTFRATINCEETNKGLTKGTIQDILEALVDDPRAVPFVNRSREYMVDLVALSGSDVPGKDDRSVRNVSLIEAFEVDA
jgi:hypothetical protein